LEKEYITNQISVYKTDKKLMELKDKLRYASILKYAHIHAYGEKDENGRNINSNIGLLLQDYSNGTGNNTVKVEFNISPLDVKYIFSRLKSGQVNFELKQDKISPITGENGKNFVSKLTVKRASIGPDGKPRNYPWTISVENGYGIAAKAETGGTYIKPNSYQKEKYVFININDQDLFKLLDGVNTFIEVWEKFYGEQLLEMKERTVRAIKEQEANEKVNQVNTTEKSAA